MYVVDEKKYNFIRTQLKLQKTTKVVLIVQILSEEKQQMKSIPQNWERPATTVLMRKIIK